MPRPAKSSKGNARPGVTGSGSTGGDRRPPGAAGAGRPAPGAEDTGPGQGRGALSASRGQVSVQNMIRALNRDGSPSKRQRPASREDSSSREEWEDEDGAEGQLTAIGKLIRRELQQQTARLSEEFRQITDGLTQELRRLHQQVGELERHVSNQGDTIQHLYEVVDSRDRRIWALEGEVEELRREANVPVLVFDGPGLPAPPQQQPWKEDVTATAIDMLHQYMPAVEVQASDFVRCHRVNRGKAIACRFACWGPGSVRDAIFDARMRLGKNQQGQRRDPGDQIFVNEQLTPGALEAYKKLRAARKKGEIHSVHTRYGHMYVRMFEHGAKIRVSNRTECERVLRGDV